MHLGLWDIIWYEKPPANLSFSGLSLEVIIHRTNRWSRFWYARVSRVEDFIKTSEWKKIICCRRKVIEWIRMCDPRWIHLHSYNTFHTHFVQGIHGFQWYAVHWGRALALSSCGVVQFHYRASTIATAEGSIVSWDLSRDQGRSYYVHIYRLRPSLNIKFWQTSIHYILLVIFDSASD